MKFSLGSLFYIALAIGLVGFLAHSTYHYLGRFSGWQSKGKRWLAISPLIGGIALILVTVIAVGMR
jgi:ABC-type nickel/cobalt efflux system permease component RcnA